ncbi:uncharacterized protein LOC123679859 isoform X2 [Harmonia axyridis]|uniref:uncharacterized protein LOC123679859 isoform X2 n=1 Tax=Harmonia axyridis TaxID=115357 RepID=UPI001E277367|nr:uncharacterized protein LOC123679859 isoform X2 [Harmonia axyridis]
MDQQALCSICDTVLINDTDTVVSVKERGLKKLIEKSIEKEDRKSELWLGKIEVSFHEKCRKSYPMSTSSIKRKSKLSTDPSSSHFTSSVVGPSILPVSTSTNLNFDFVNLCFFCKMSLDRKHKRVHLIANKYTQDQILDIARRQNDEFSTELIKRIKDINLVDCKASYHHKCYVNFNKLVKEPKISTLKEQTARIFNQICKHIEESCQYTFSLRELKDIMGDDPLSNFVLFRMLKEKYKDDIFISHHRGKEPMIYYKTFDISNVMIPIMSNAEPAPKELIDKVSCSCKTNCLSARCGCKKSGLKCNKFCKSCQGQSCDNASERSFNLEDDENEDKEDEERDDSDDENDDDGNVYEDENDGEEETTVKDGEQENEAICTGRKTFKNTRSKVSTQKNQLCISKM